MAEATLTYSRWRVERLLGVNTSEKPRVYAEIFQSAEIMSFRYWVELILSAGIATLGLVLNSPAVVIGAMLISPLMGPILAAGLALAAADLYLGVKSLLNIIASMLGAIGFSALLVWLLPFHSSTQEILSRTNPNLLDLGVALFSGLAGAVLVCRSRNGGATALPGVAIAVALMPPLCTVGFGVGSSFEWKIISGAGLLFLTNLAAIVASAFAVFFAVRMDEPDVREEIDRTIRGHASTDRLYLLLQKTALSRSLADIGRLQWRILMLAIVLLILFVPLRRSLLQVRDETVALAAVREGIRRLAPADAIVAKQVELGPERIHVRMILTESVAPAKVADVQRYIMKRTGKDVDLLVRKVAGEEELALLKEQLRTPPPLPLQDLETVRVSLLPELEKPLRETWPSNAGVLLDYALGFGPKDVFVSVRYEGAQPLGPDAQEMLRNVLRTRLGLRQLRLEVQQVEPEPPANAKTKARKRVR